MHSSAKRNLERFFKTYYENKNSVLEVLDLGSQSLNKDWATCKSILETSDLKFNYTGADIEAGLNVDLVIKQIYSFKEIPSNKYDVVTATSVFEHVEFFWLTYLEILRVLKPGGLFYMNTPSNGDFHRWPVDCWRFYPDSSNALVNWGNKNNYNSVLLESFTAKQFLECGWSDNVAIILKDKANINNFNSRMIHQYKNFTNGIDDQKKLYNFSNKTEDHSNYGYRFYYRIRKKLQKLKLID
jgi:SAM-dependent methyltransferase